MTRAEHLNWAKQRALAYLPANPMEAFASMMSDMRKHPESCDHVGIDLGMGLKMGGFLAAADEVRRWVEGFN